MLGAFRKYLAVQPRNVLLLCCLFAGLSVASGQKRPEHAVDRSTLTGKLILGYQGWFSCPTSADKAAAWTHWQHRDQVTVEMLPDTSELTPAELCPTPWKTSAGKPISLYSSPNPRTINRHFQWMEQYGLDGVALQRFATDLRNPSRTAVLNQVLSNVASSAQRHGRSFFVEYDLSGIDPRTGLATVLEDWKALEVSGLVYQSAYQHHRGHPVVGIFGLGFVETKISPAAAKDFLTKLRSISAAYGGVTIFAAVPSYWRTGTRDASPDEGWKAVYRSVDIISPWSVGRFASEAGSDSYRKSVTEPDLVETRWLKIDYMPVVFPGFSWHNLMASRGKDAPLNQITRNCGKFYWHQIDNSVDAGSSMLFNAMFDEVDEGTAMFKAAPNQSSLPQHPEFLSLGADGCHVSSDWYLRLAGAATAVVARRIPVSTTIPIQPH